jgi:dTDP-4-dehydrorhamnose reductase
METILFAGGSSLLASSWIRSLDHNYNYILSTHKKKIKNKKFRVISLDYSTVDQVLSQLKKHNVKILINCIGLTNIEECETDPDKALNSNTYIPKVLSKACDEGNIKFVHISTDHLYDGKKSYYSEKTPKSPLNIYGETKSKAEDEVLKNNKKINNHKNKFLWLGTKL